MKKNYTFFALAFLSVLSASAQSLMMPPSGGNQRSSVSQWMGPVKVTVDYNSPDVTGDDGKSRKGEIWGKDKLVPYGFNDLQFGTSKAAPWRAGANENTVITFSNDVTVEGKALKAGSYGLFMAPSESDWIIIFSKNHTSWGSYYYNESEDALRVTVKPTEAPFHEWLSYEFDDRKLDKCTLSLYWEDIRVPIQISVPNINDLYIQSFREDLRSTAGFSWNNWVTAASFCVQNKTNLEEALVWADNGVNLSFGGEKNFTTLQTKASVLEALGRTAEAQATMKEAIEHATASVLSIHFYARQLQTQGKKAEALEIFKFNAKKNAGQWPVSLGLARGYSANGDYKNALKYAEIALKEAPDAGNKKNIEGYIVKLKKNEDIN